MQAIELEAMIQKDGQICLPAIYKNWFGKRAKLILLETSEPIFLDRWTDTSCLEGLSVHPAGIEFTGFWTDGQIGQLFYLILGKYYIHARGINIIVCFF